jgi:hypothetical protein
LDGFGQAASALVCGYLLMHIKAEARTQS